MNTYYCRFDKKSLGSSWVIRLFLGEVICYEIEMEDRRYPTGSKLGSALQESPKSILRKLVSYVFPRGTLPETKIAPENRPLEKEIPIGNHHF